jgi:hypothetical protein
MHSPAQAPFPTKVAVTSPCEIASVSVTFVGVGTGDAVFEGGVEGAFDGGDVLGVGVGVLKVGGVGDGVNA